MSLFKSVFTSLTTHVQLAAGAAGGACTALLADPAVRTFLAPVMGALGALVVSFFQHLKRKLDADAGKGPKDPPSSSSTGGDRPALPPPPPAASSPPSGASGDAQRAAGSIGRLATALVLAFGVTFAGATMTGCASFGTSIKDHPMPYASAIWRCVVGVFDTARDNGAFTGTALDPAPASSGGAEPSATTLMDAGASDQ